jgi:hypothetical protein
MSGTKSGGIKAAKTNKELYGQDFYKNIGADGGRAGKGGGFAATGYAAIAGKIGGMKAAHTRYGTPIDKAKMKQLEKELATLKSYRKYRDNI